MEFVQAFYDHLAKLTYAIIDLVVIEVLLAAVFHVEDGRIKYTFDWLRGPSKFRSTTIFVYGFFIVGVAFFFLSNYLQDSVVKFFSAQGVKLFLIFFMAVTFMNFWLSKVVLNRRWKSLYTYVPGVLFILSVILSLVFFVFL